MRDLLLAPYGKLAGKTHRLIAIDLYGAFVGLYRWFAVVSHHEFGERAVHPSEARYLAEPDREAVLI